MANLPELEQVVLRIQNGSGGIDSILIDACVTEQHTLANTLTDHPVEQGANITDHSRPEPRRVTLDCVQSNTPPSGTDGTDRARELWRRFVDLHVNPRLIDVTTVRDLYVSMGVENVTSPVDVKTSQALKFTATLKEVRVVQNKFTQIIVTKTPAGQPKRDSGKVSTRTAELPPESKTVVQGAFGAGISVAQ